MFEGAPV